MSAEEIRAAAAKIREVAAEAAPGPWCADYTREAIRHVERNCDIDCPTHSEDIRPCGSPGRFGGGHVALWDPVVAELVAKMLDCSAESFDHIDWINSRPGEARTRIIGLNQYEQAALDLARAINGGGVE